jgi:hypothetical protein
MNNSQTSSPALGSYRMYIDGQWSNIEASETIEVENPANEDAPARKNSQCFDLNLAATYEKLRDRSRIPNFRSQPV